MKKLSPYLIAIFLLLISALLLSSCSNNKSSVQPPDKESFEQAPIDKTNQKIKIVASFYPAYEIAKKVGGEKVEVTNLVPPGVEPHDYEPTPQDIIKLQKASLLIINGSGLEPWVKKTHQTLVENKVKILDQSAAIQNFLISQSATSKEKEHTNVKTLENHSHEVNGNFDPHFWLDPLYYQIEIGSIAEQLGKIDPSNSSYYLENSKKYQEEIAELHQKYENSLKNCKQKIIITNHQAFNYLARRYNFEVLSISGINPDSEPSAKELAELSQLVKEKGISYIFTETLLNPKIADTLARETGVKTLVLNPIENLTTEEIARNENYVTLMKENLKNIQRALVCNS